MRIIRNDYGRISRTEGADITNFHLSGKSDLADYWTNAGGGIAGQLTRGPDGLISFTTDPTSSPFPCYQLFSPHGDTTMITDSGGSSFWQTRYDAFGNVVGGATPWYGYLGKYERYTDETAHLIQMGVRDYDPAAGRFTSADPLKGPATDPQQRNRYQYVGNDPLTRYDLSGREVQAPDDLSYYEIDRIEGYWNDVSQEGLEDDNAVTGFFKWAGGNIFSTVLDFGPEAAQDTGRAWGDPCASNWDRFTATTELVLDASMLIGPEIKGGSEAAGNLRKIFKLTKSRDWAEMSGMLRDAAIGKGNFTIGEATQEQADALGKAWLGKDYQVASDGRTLISSDGLRQYRPPSFKPSLGRTQANLERRLPGMKQWISNAHIDIIK